MGSKMNYDMKNRLHRKGFRPGNLPYQNTVLKDVILVGQRVYQVKTRDAKGDIISLHPRTWLRNNLIVFRFYLWSVRRFFTASLMKLISVFQTRLSKQSES